MDGSVLHPREERMNEDSSSKKEPLEEQVNEDSSSQKNPLGESTKDDLVLQGGFYVQGIFNSAKCGGLLLLPQAGRKQKLSRTLLAASDWF